jgi:hypothetical protein
MKDSDKSAFRTIWKYSISLGEMAQAVMFNTAGIDVDINSIISIDMPKGAEILSVHEQRGIICCWALVFPNTKERETRRFAIYGTGYPIFNEKRMTFLGSAFFMEESFVFHVFEIFD